MFHSALSWMKGLLALAAVVAVLALVGCSGGSDATQVAEVFPQQDEVADAAMRTLQAVADTKVSGEMLNATRTAFVASVDVKQMHYRNGAQWWEWYFYTNGIDSLTVMYHENGVPAWIWIHDATGVKRWSVRLYQDGSVDFARAFDANGTRIVDPN